MVLCSGSEQVVSGSEQQGSARPTKVGYEVKVSELVLRMPSGQQVAYPTQ